VELQARDREQLKRFIYIVDVTALEIIGDIRIVQRQCSVRA